MKVAQTQTKQKAFTIIEVVLVLAIAGLIFLIVFLALPALQRSQRDTQRKNDLGRFLSQLTQYQSNHSGQTPAQTGHTNANWNAFIASYLTVGGESFADPEGTNYTSNAVAATATAPSTTKGTLSIYTGATCTNGLIAAKTGTRNIAVAIPLEAGGYACQSN